MSDGRKNTKVIAHRGGKAHGRENDAETITRALAYKPDVVEVDVHKSSDGVLYCYHGSIPLGVIAASFLYHFTFAWIQRLVGKRDTLEKILRVIPEDTTVLLDLKDQHITGEELAPFVAKREHIWVMTSSEKHTQILRKTFDEGVEYVSNKPLFFIRHVLPMVLGFTDTLHLVVDGERERFFAYKDLSDIREH